MTETKPNQAHRGVTVRRWLRRGLIGALIAGAAALLVLALAPQPIRVETAVVDRGPLETTVDEAGRTRVIDRYVVRAPLTGTLARIELHPSDTVTAGSPVAYLVPAPPALLDARTRSEAEARLAEARARRESARFAIGRARESAAFAEREATRVRALVGSGASPGRELDAAEVELRTRATEVTSLEFASRVADHEVRAAEAGLGRLSPTATAEQQVEVTAPVDGVVLRLIEMNAGPVATGASLLELGDPSALEIVADVLTSDAIQIARGAQVRIDRWGGDELLAAHVRLVEPSAHTRVSALGVEEQRVDVVIDLDDPRERWAALGDGYRVEVHIVVWRGEDVVRVPASAVFRRDESWSVFTMEGGVARLRPIEVGHRSRDAIEVTGGLEPGSTVIVYPGESVLDGVAVIPRVL